MSSTASVTNPTSSDNKEPLEGDPAQVPSSGAQ